MSHNCTIAKFRIEYKIINVRGYCELCGEENILVGVLIEGEVYKVCKKCAVGHRQVPIKMKSATPPPQKAASITKPTPLKRDNTQVEQRVVSNAGKLIKMAREKKGMTREQLAPLVGEKVNVISRIENGDWIPPLSLARKFEKVLGITLVETISDEEEKEPQKKIDMSLTVGDVAVFED